MYNTLVAHGRKERKSSSARLLLLLGVLCCNRSNADQQLDSLQEEKLQEKIDGMNFSKEKPQQLLVPFSFERHNLLALLDNLAEKKQLILVLPVGVELEALKKQLITYQPPRFPEIPLNEAWRLLVTFLELSGFSLIHLRGNVYSIIGAKTPEGARANREPLALYVDAPVRLLPAYPEHIRYLYSLKNLKVPQPQERESHPLNTMLKQLLSPGASLLFDAQSNSIIMTDKAPHIAATIPIIQALEAHGFQEQIDYVPLSFVPAQGVIQIFDSLKKASGELSPPTGGSESAPSYFAQDVRIIAHESNNAVILMGKESSIGRISDFIKNSLDQPQESGKSILHFYDLQYRDAQTFAPQLQKAVSSLIEGDNQAAQAPPTGSFERYLQGVVVVAEAFVEVQKTATTEKELLERKGGMEVLGIEGAQKIGGNRLIVVAMQDQWKVVKQLIKKLDIKRRQVLLEIFIVDFTYDNNTIVASDLRNLTGNCSSTPGVQFLASHISTPSSVLGTTPVQLAQDLLQIVGPQQLTNRLPLGSLLISLNDPVTPGIFGLLQVLQRTVSAKIQSHPFLVITDNQTGSVESEEVRFIQGDLVTTTNGTYTIPLENVSAALKVVATPHIANDNRIRLDIGFTADEFISTSSNTRLTRGLKTTATLSSGQILAMGGLLRNDTLALETYTPIVGKVPLAGVFFRGENRDDTITNVVLFASPIIIEPRQAQAAKKQYTQEKISDVILYENILENPQDPVYRLFFRDEPTYATMNEYFSESSNMQDIFIANRKGSTALITKKKPILKNRTFRVNELKDLLVQDTPPQRRIKGPTKASLKVP